MRFLRPHFLIYSAVGIGLAWLFGEPSAVAVAKGSSKIKSKPFKDPFGFAKEVVKAIDPVGGDVLDMVGESKLEERRRKEAEGTRRPGLTAAEPVTGSETAELEAAKAAEADKARRRLAGGSAGTVLTSPFGTEEAEVRPGTRRKKLLGTAIY